MILDSGSFQGDSIVILEVIVQEAYFVLNRSEATYYVGLKIVTWLVDIMGLIGILGTEGRLKCKIYSIWKLKSRSCFLCQLVPNAESLF